MSTSDAIEALQIELQFRQLRAEERHDLAVALGERLLEIRGAEPGAARPELAALMVELAESYLLTGRSERAEELLRRAIELFRDAPEPDIGGMAAAFHGLALRCQKRGNLVGAEKICRPAIALRTRLHGPDAVPVRESQALLATILLAKKELDEADRLFEAGKLALEHEDPKRALHPLTVALTIRDKYLGRTHLDLVDTLHRLGDANLELGKLGAAESAYRRIGEIYAASYPADTEWHSIGPALLGEVAMKRKAYARAAEHFEQALAIAERAFGLEDIRLQVLLDKAGEAQLQAGSLERAGELTRRLLALCEPELGPEHPALFPMVRRLGDVYLRTNDPRAEEMVRRSMAFLEEATRETVAETSRLRAELARRAGRS